METRLVNLQLVLEELGVDPSIDTLDDRVTFQKAIYLAQAVGVPLGYRYSWYIKGPYSRDLARDYYALHELDRPVATATPQAMRESFASALKKLKALMDTPDGVPLGQREWLELLSSVHFLRITEKMTSICTRNQLDLQKPSLSQYTTRATQCLARLGLLER